MVHGMVTDTCKCGKPAELRCYWCYTAFCRDCIAAQCTDAPHDDPHLAMHGKPATVWDHGALGDGRADDTVAIKLVMGLLGQW